MDAAGRGGIVGLGLDLQCVKELDEDSALLAPGLFLTDREAATVAASAEPPLRLTTLFCIKEAFFKAMPIQRGWSWTDLEVVRDGLRPRLEAHGPLGALLRAQGWTALLSVSHSGGFVAAQVVLISNGDQVSIAG
jgi:holo-[acyl-carrier protein] synthase